MRPVIVSPHEFVREVTGGLMVSTRKVSACKYSWDWVLRRVGGKGLNSLHFFVGGNRVKESTNRKSLENCSQRVTE
jgi:hypothetical protein